MHIKNNKILIIGIGNEFRGDDGAGIICARKIKEKVNSNASVIESDGDGASLMESWKCFNKVILIDSISSGAKPGTIQKFSGNKAGFSNRNSARSSHLFSVAEAIKTSKILNKLPGNLVTYGIEGKSYELGSKISSEVSKAIRKLVKIIEKEI
jgi:hydrogenase maturation protease